MNVEPFRERLLELRNVGDMREQPEFDLAVVRADEDIALVRDERGVDLPPSSVRMGMFCRLGSLDDKRPVDVDAIAYDVCTRPVCGLM